MEKSQQEFYEDVYALTGTPEWRTLVEHLEERLQAVMDRAIDAADIETLYFLKGQREVLKEIVYLRDTYEAQEKAEKFYEAEKANETI